MNTVRAGSTRYGVLFSLSLIVSWLGATPLLAIAFWSGPHSRDAVVAWVCVWIFTVAIPTLQAVRLHRRLNDVLHACPSLAPPVRRDIAHTRFVLLMCGTMTVLAVIALRP